MTKVRVLGFNFVNDGNLQRSRREPLHFDQPEVAMPFLDRFGKGNAHIIGQLPLRTSFTVRSLFTLVFGARH